MEKKRREILYHISLKYSANENWYAWRIHKHQTWRDTVCLNKLKTSAFETREKNVSLNVSLHLY